jgi:Tol biopolymer transport system component
MSRTRVRKAIPALALAVGAVLAVPTAATPPGQNGQISWGREPKGDGFPHLVVANPDGTDVRRVFADAANRGEILGRFSPTDPNVMFFSRFKPRPFGEDLFSGNLATGDVQRIRGADSADIGAAVSPDGTKIAYFAVRRPAKIDFDVPPPPERIHVMNVDGSSDEAITPRRQRSIDPDWSPDGSQIAYMQLRFAGETPQERLVVMNADGSGRRPLTRFGGVDERNPKWMPDGETIVYERFRESGKLSDIATVDVTDGTQQTVLATKHWDTNPVPSPDGTRIVFTSNRDRPGAENRLGRGFEVYTMDLDGSNIARLTNNRRPDLFPDWQRLP